MPALAKYKLDLAAPHTIYRNAAGKRLPGVTTILGVLDKPALLAWAAREERDHWMNLVVAAAQSDGILPDFVGPYAYAVKRDRAADIGTVAHARIHAYLRGMELDEEGLPAEAVDKSQNAFIRWHDWWRGEQVELIATEQPMVSEELQVGGTLDIVASASGNVLVDIKTSKPNAKYWPYDEHVAQVAAYRLLWDELHPERIARACIYRVGKEQDDPGEVTWLGVSQLSAGEDLFRAALAAYRAKGVLGRVK